MSRLEDLQPDASVRGILPDCLVTVVSIAWFGSNARELTYKDPSGRMANTLLYRDDEPRVQVVEQGRPWSFDGDGDLFRLVSEAHRIRLAHLSDLVPPSAPFVEPLSCRLEKEIQANMSHKRLLVGQVSTPRIVQNVGNGLWRSMSMINLNQ